MHETIVAVADSAVRILSPWKLDLSRYYETAESSELSIILQDADSYSAVFEPPYRELRCSAPGNLEQLARQLALYLGCFHSERYQAVHGCGLVADGAGILFSGNSGSGKSLMRELHPRAQVLDDDILMLDTLGGRMLVTGKRGTVTDEVETARILVEPRSPLREATLDLVVLLDSALPSGHLERREAIPRSYAKLDALPDVLQSAYCALPDIESTVPVHLLGTKGKRRELLAEAVRSLMPR